MCQGAIRAHTQWWKSVTKSKHSCVKAHAELWHLRWLLIFREVTPEDVSDGCRVCARVCWTCLADSVRMQGGRNGGLLARIDECKVLGGMSRQWCGHRMLVSTRQCVIRWQELKQMSPSRWWALRFMNKRWSLRVCMCEREKERERVCMWEEEGNRCTECAFVCVCVRERWRESTGRVCVCGRSRPALQMLY